MSSNPRDQPVWLWWSGGKDSAWVLHTLRNDPRWDVRGLVTLVNRKNGRVSAHGVRRRLIELQAAAVGLPLKLIQFDWAASTTDHDIAIWEGLFRLRQDDGAESVAFSELCSHRARARRSALLNRVGLRPVFPLWDRDPAEHAAQMLRAGLKARVCSVETDRVSGEQVGCRYDEGFLSKLPQDVDPCGEYGEFHTFVEWAPGWSSEVRTVSGARIECYGFALAEVEETPRDLQPAPQAQRKEGTRRLHDANDPFNYYARLRRVREHVDQHLAEPLNLAAMAPVVGMSAGGFGRFFREVTGQPFQHWLAGRRLERAAVLLRDHNERIGLVAETVGFGSERTFRRKFLQRFGCTPSRFRCGVRSEGETQARTMTSR